MRFPVLCFAVICVIMAGKAFAGGLSEIEMRDGSVIRAEIISLERDRYTLRSSSLGTIQIEQSNVKAIRMDPSEGVAAGNAKGTQALTDGQIKALQERLISDEAAFDTILSLQDDPDFKEALNDPDFMRAVTSGDISALTSSPILLKLLNKPAVQSIGKDALK